MNMPYVHPLAHQDRLANGQLCLPPRDVQRVLCTREAPPARVGPLNPLQTGGLRIGGLLPAILQMAAQGCPALAARRGG